MKKSKLAHIKQKGNGFKIPEGYFDAVEDAVFAKIATEKFAKKEGFTYPKGYFDAVEGNVLAKIREEKLAKETGFAIPDNYLNTVEDHVLTKLDQENKQVKVINFKSVLLKRVLPVAAAASLALFIFMNYNNKPVDPLKGVALTDIEQWIDEDLVTFDTYEIAEVYHDIELEDENTFSEEDEELLEYLDGTDIENMLLEN